MNQPKTIAKHCGYYPACSCELCRRCGACQNCKCFEADNKRGRGRPQLSDDERGHQITIYMSADNYRWYESLTKMTRAKHINRALQEYRATRESAE